MGLCLFLKANKMLENLINGHRQLLRRCARYVDYGMDKQACDILDYAQPMVYKMDVLADILPISFSRLKVLDVCKREHMLSRNEFNLAGWYLDNNLNAAAMILIHKADVHRHKFSILIDLLYY